MLVYVLCALIGALTIVAGYLGFRLYKANGRAAGILANATLVEDDTAFYYIYPPEYDPAMLSGGTAGAADFTVKTGGPLHFATPRGYDDAGRG